MVKEKAHFFWVAALALSFSTMLHKALNRSSSRPSIANARQNQNDHSNWIYLEDIHKPKEHTLQWVAATQQGSVQRVLEKDSQKLPESRQRDLVQGFLHDPKAQKKQLSEANHDNQQADDLLKLLPVCLYLDTDGHNDNEHFPTFRTRAKLPSAYA